MGSHNLITEEQSEIIYRYYNRVHIDEIVKMTNLEPGAIRYHARAKLKLFRKPSFKKTKRKKWTAKDEFFLIQHYKDMTFSQLAEKLGTDAQAIKNKIYRMKLKTREHPYIPDIISDEKFWMNWRVIRYWLNEDRK